MEELNFLEIVAGKGNKIETKYSGLLLQDEFVFKIRKPVINKSVDYRNNKLKRGYAILEKDLASRFGDVYVDVLKISKTGAFYSFAPVQSSLPAADYVVKMKRIPECKFLKNNCDANFFKIGQLLAEKLSGIDRVEITGIEYVEQLYKRLDYFKYVIDNKNAIVIISKMEKFISKYKKLFENRVDSVIDGHGNILLEHIILDEDVSLISPIVYNSELRKNDLFYELMITAVDIKIDMNEGFEAFVNGVKSKIKICDELFHYYMLTALLHHSLNYDGILNIAEEYAGKLNV